MEKMENATLEGKVEIKLYICILCLSLLCMNDNNNQSPNKSQSERGETKEAGR